MHALSGSCNPPEVSTFVASLGEDWIKLAEYMGYDLEVIRYIDNIHPRCIAEQQQKFLRLWRMPDLGVYRTASILEKIRKSAGLCENLQKIPRGICLIRDIPIFHSIHFIEIMKEDTIYHTLGSFAALAGHFQHYIFLSLPSSLVCTCFTLEKRVLWYQL